MNYLKEVLEICQDFLKVPSVLCFEKPFLEYLSKRIKSLGYQVILDKDFNYLSVLGKNKKRYAKYLFSSHIDRHGIVKDELGNLQYAGFYFKNKLNLKFKRDEILNNELDLIENLNKLNSKDNIKNDFDFFLKEDFLMFKNKITGQVLKYLREDSCDFFRTIGLRYSKENIFSYDKITGEILDNFFVKRYDLDINKREVFFDVDKKLNKKDKVFFIENNLEISEDKIFGQIDNVISCSVLFYLLKNFDFDDEIIFSTKEEIGLSYKSVLNYIDEFEKDNLKLIVIDTSPYYDFNNYKTGFLTLRFGDERHGFDLDLTKNIQNFFKINNIDFDFKPSFIGNTELGKICKFSSKKILGTTIQLPTLNYHTSFETTTIKSLENYVKILKYLISN